MDTQKKTSSNAEPLKKGNATPHKVAAKMRKVKNSPDEKRLREYASLHATTEQLAVLLNVSVATLERPLWRKIIQEEKEKTVYKLKKKATDMGLAGNATMLIFALKNLAKWNNNEQIQETKVTKSKEGFTIKVLNKQDTTKE